MYTLAFPGKFLASAGASWKNNSNIATFFPCWQILRFQFCTTSDGPGLTSLIQRFFVTFFQRNLLLAVVEFSTSEAGSSGVALAQLLLPTTSIFFSQFLKSFIFTPLVILRHAENMESKIFLSIRCNFFTRCLPVNRADIGCSRVWMSTFFNQFVANLPESAIEILRFLKTFKIWGFFKK